MTVKRIGSWLQILAIVFMSSVVMMCQTVGEKKEREYHDAQFNQYVYASNCRQLWPSVKGFLAKDQFRLPDPVTSDRSFLVESEWKDTSFGSSRTRERIIVQARDVEAKGCSLELNQKTEDRSGPHTNFRNERDSWRERKLMETIEPTRYQKIIQEGARLRTEADAPK